LILNVSRLIISLSYYSLSLYCITPTINIKNNGTINITNSQTPIVISPWDLIMKLSLLILSLLLTSFGFAQTNIIQVIESPKTQVQLIELYTSEGCSSCPSADKFIQTHANNNPDDLWKKFIPLAFHVDYWSYLGWSDRFTLPNNPERHKLHRDQGTANSIYTPEFVINGQEWTNFYSSDKTLPNSEQPVGHLRAEISDNGHIDIKFDALETGTFKTTHHKYLNIAILGMDLSSQVDAGENKGKRLTHDFVVLNKQQVRSENHHWQAQLPDLTNFETSNLAIAIWIEENKSLRPIQAVGDFLMPIR
jgi:hypothetical protein